ncbi:MAG TPA: DUF1003 domain-containing protein [Fimbriimonadaceae bacterium]|nr:DUF1003 domain-containing protein [Fimbriimonadaceae bacterium]
MDTVDERTTGERIADAVASFGGSWRFILTAVAIIWAWVGYNLLAPAEARFDSYPFILLNLFLSLIAAFQAPFILMSQGRAEKKAETAHRRTLRGIRRLVKKDIEIEKEILLLLKNQNKDIEQEILQLLKNPKS